ncbi:MAG: hypothetical protein HY074_07955 [Deltaproteobacteria bacterium]|nr:hypothetical protein [Deltaproteobacteria bacterium]
MKTRTKALWIFLGFIAITVGSLLVFIQSKYFAHLLKDVARTYMPTDFGVGGNFSELSVKLIPPGVVIKSPAIVLKEKNPAGLPAGTKLDAQYIDITFQFFQLVTGAITINAFAIHGASLTLDLDEQFFAAHEAQPKPKLPAAKFSWDSLVHFNFRSVSLVDSQFDLRISREARVPVHVQAYAKELTIGRSTVDRLPSYDLAVDLQKAFLEIGAFKHSVSQLQGSVELSAAGAQIRNFGVQDGELSVHTTGEIHGNLLKPKTLKSDLNYVIRGRLHDWLDADLAGRFVQLPKNTPLDGLIAIEGRVSGDIMDFGHTLEAKDSNP